MSHLWQMKTWQKLGDKKKKLHHRKERVSENLILLFLIFFGRFHSILIETVWMTAVVVFDIGKVLSNFLFVIRRDDVEKASKKRWGGKISGKWRKDETSFDWGRSSTEKNEFKEDNEKCQEVRHLSSWHHWWCCKLVMGLFLLPIWKVNSAAGWAAMASVGWPKRQIRRLRFT